MSFHKLHGFNVAGRYDIENMIARRRTKEAEVLSQWKDQSKYYNQALVRAEKEKHWTSKNNFNSSMQAYSAQTEEEDSNSNVAPRRAKLKQLLDEEISDQKILLEAISEQSKDKSAMLVRCTALKQTRDQERAELARKLLEKHFMINNADLNKIIREKEQVDCINTWDEQKERRHRLEEEERRNELAAQEEQEERRREERREDDELKMRHLIAKQEHLKILQQQLDEIHRREAEAKQLADEESQLAAELAKLDKLEKEREAIEEQCKRELYGRALLRQHQAALRRRSALVQAEMKADLEWLARIAEEKAQDEQQRLDKQYRERNNVAAMRELIQADLERERKQELELDALQSHEAARLWSRREEEWRKETEARQRLLHGVLEERRAQLAEQLEHNRKRQQDELESRETLLEALEQAQQEDLARIQDRDLAKFDQYRQLESQINQRQEIEAETKRKAEADERATRQAETAYEEMLRQEAERLRLADTRDSTTRAMSSRTGASVPIRSKPGGNIW